MDYVKEAAGKFDEVVESFGVKVYIDPRALLHIVGSTMDFVDDHVWPPSASEPFVSFIISSAKLLCRRCGLSLCSKIRIVRASAAAANRSTFNADSPMIAIVQRLMQTPR
jgi:hypothetical protein